LNPIFFLQSKGGLKLLGHEKRHQVPSSKVKKLEVVRARPVKKSDSRRRALIGVEKERGGWQRRVTRWWGTVRDQRCDAEAGASLIIADGGGSDTLS
jgi:hypothetical protein